MAIFGEKMSDSQAVATRELAQLLEYGDNPLFGQSDGQEA